MSTPTMKYPISLPLPPSQDSVGLKGVDSSLLTTPLATLHHPHPHLWELEMHSGPKNILTPFFMTVCLLKALNIVERDWRSQHGVASGGPGALVISGKRDQEQYFSAGGDIQTILDNPSILDSSFAPALVRLLTFPMPTIAALNGHTFGAGFALALCCDYRVMQTSNGWCGMGEIFAGTSLGSIFSAILQCKLPSVLLKRSIPLEGRKFKAKEMHDLGVVDVMAENGGAAIEAARQLALERADLARTGVWGINKTAMMKDTVDSMLTPYQLVSPAQEAAAYALSRL